MWKAAADQGAGGRLPRRGLKQLCDFRLQGWFRSLQSLRSGTSLLSRQLTSAAFAACLGCRRWGCLQTRDHCGRLGAALLQQFNPSWMLPSSPCHWSMPTMLPCGYVAARGRRDTLVRSLHRHLIDTCKHSKLSGAPLQGDDNRLKLRDGGSMVVKQIEGHDEDRHCGDCRPIIKSCGQSRPLQLLSLNNNCSSNNSILRGRPPARGHKRVMVVVMSGQCNECGVQGNGVVALRSG